MITKVGMPKKTTTKTLFLITRKGNVIVFDIKIPSVKLRFNLVQINVYYGVKSWRSKF